MPENKIAASIELPPLGLGGFYVNPGKGQGHSARRGRARFPDLLHSLAHPGNSLKKSSDIPFGELRNSACPPRPSRRCETVSCSSFEDRREEAVGAVQMRPKLEIFLHMEGDPLFLKHLARGLQMELRVTRQKPFGDPAVFLFQNAAGRVDEPSSGPDEPGSPGEYRVLLLDKLGHALRRLAPFHVGIAAQGAEPAAGRVHENAVDLAGETLHPRIVRALYALRMDVREPRAGEPRLQAGEAFRRDVERVE